MTNKKRRFQAAGLLTALMLLSTTHAAESAVEPMADLDAWSAVKLMGFGANIGNTLENTTQWETGWGNPRITKEFIASMAAMGIKTVRLPVAWDTYARDGQIQKDKLERVGEVVNWITSAGMFCVVNIHWDGGWIDSSNKDRFKKTHATFSADAQKKFPAYWNQIASYFAGKNERLVFEGLNEETNFEGEGSTKKAYETLTRVNQIFIDTVRKTGGNNAKRLLIVTGYATDITKTTNREYVLPTDTVPHRLMISVHYYTPWQFAGMTEDASWGKMQPTWGSSSDVAELNRLFDDLQAFTKRNDIPAFVGEFGVTDKKEVPSRVRWMSAVVEAASTRQMVPVLWDTGGDIARRSPYGPSPALQHVLEGAKSLVVVAPPPESGGGKQDVIRELGSALGWRLGPELVEEQCRAVDPDGAKVRSEALKSWQGKYARLIQEVDARVAEVVPLLYKTPKPNAVPALRAQVKGILVESIFAGKSPDEVKAVCKAEANPESPRWNNSGMPDVQQSLAELYDWKVSRGN